MPPRPCLTCGTPTNGTRCDHCRRTQERNRTRPTAHQRGYNAAHQAARAQLATTLPTPCGYGWCRPIKILTPDTPWVAAHIVDGDPTAGWIAACRSCNELAKRRKGDGEGRGRVCDGL